MKHPQQARSWLYRLEPRAKMVVLLSLILSVFFLRSVLLLLVLSLTLALALMAWGTSLPLGRRMLRALAFGFPFTLFLFIASLWRPDAALRENLVPGALAATVFTLRIVCIALGNLLLISTTDPRELSTSLRAWRIPLEVCLMVTAVLRFMPLMDEQARRILDAQRCRGFSLKRLWHPKAWMPIFVPLLVHALHRSETMATSMELRGLRLGALHPHLARKWRWQERAISATSMIICAVIIAGGGV